MTSPALCVLFLALLSSSSSKTQNPSADHDLALSPDVQTYRDNVDEMISEDSPIITNLAAHRLYLNKYREQKMRNFDDSEVLSRNKRETDNYKCEAFTYNDKDSGRDIWHPHPRNSSYYYNSTDCVTVINATEGQIIELIFVDVFRIESHPECAYDYLEIRDGLQGYSKLLSKLCGTAFPRQISTTGPNAWLKFHSDDTIEYEGFHINISFKAGASHSIPASCYIPVEGSHGVIDSSDIDEKCKTGSLNHALDVLWIIKAPENMKIYLNFTSYSLAQPNECEENVIQVFGSVLELDSKLAHYCGSMANSVTTKDDGKGPTNIMHVRLYASKTAKDKTSFNANFTSYRTMDPGKDDKCSETEFDCEDNTCINITLKCDAYANCRLKADEDIELCKTETESVIKKTHIMVILVIFSLILSGMSFVFLFKCIRKLYQDHKIIKEHIRQSCEDRLDSLVGSRLTLDPKRLQRDSEPRASLERENHANKMFQQQRSFSKPKQSSIDSDYIQETHLDIDDEPWRREVDSVPIEADDIRIERNGRTRRSDMSRKEESIRSKRKESEDVREKKQIRDVSVGAPDTKESGCQTRESLFQTDPPPSSDGSGSNSRGFSTFGYSGATIARPSPTAQTNTSEITIELLRQVPRQESMKSQKKMADRRPISTETTRSAPDVIIVSKPIR
ncbi:neuropilin and tolloid-like protein 2 [Manduca sexta]|uniref:CUB domain-containing protein n=1 Tax=Manduca sexta TaxID=7130 RepID=A0A922CSW4_MANSE|nr:neuropilin and tolloid-like protein 2 [Manduca sexta]KAG6457101.1 hypothetical protein O3G_MSEX010111 [Manduca sexta]KAG6457102.1 hypothetical protein O3G_MSEX010111 [Manduca sexta]